MAPQMNEGCSPNPTCTGLSLGISGPVTMRKVGLAFLSAQICLFWTFYTNSGKHYVASGSPLLSGTEQF